jgi:hypothetical protein
MKASRFQALFVAVVLLVAVGCEHPDKADQLAALNNAYQSGLLTKDEYDAKRLALTGETVAVSQASAPNPAQAAVPTPKAIVRPPAHGSPVLPRHKSARPAAAPITATVPTSGTEAGESGPAPLAGCDDAEYKSGGQKGAQERFFAASPETVRRAAAAALGSLDFDIRKNSNKEIDASKRRHIGAIVGAGGERVILTFKETDHAGQSGTQVIGQTKKSFLGHMAQKTWTDAVLAQMACKLSASSR